MWNISVKYDLRLEKLISSNPQLENPNLIYPGEAIFLPGTNHIPLSQKEQLLNIVNNERIKSGLHPFRFDPNLEKVAEKKAIDMREHQYVGHKSPTYGNPKEMVRSFHIPARSVQENLGAGEASAKEIFKTWMNSQIHRQNLLEKRTTHIGIGYAEGGLHGHYWTILFIEKEE